ncbi:hypothetical protein BEN48_08880 [Hymenobacter glacialis]|uniref:Uncharacterized protein n=1 Tax=Hymenobacter glacialis TaxID=1908236 RepID=A0A1G1TCV7_9BACT|nr:hypothetical protein BEN48_08880 [Hymenobacter glacialis]
MGGFLKQLRSSLAPIYKNVMLSLSKHLSRAACHADEGSILSPENESLRGDKVLRRLRMTGGAGEMLRQAQHDILVTSCKPYPAA